MDGNDARARRAAAEPRTDLTLPRFRNVIWLMPAAYLLHIVEEYLGGFPAWVTHDVHGRFDNAAFAANNVAFMAILVTLVYANYRRQTLPRSAALVAFASANLFWDALFHLAMTPALDRYSPGVVTAMLFYYPICLVIGTVTIKERVLTRGQFTLALLGGLALFAFVVWYGLFHFAV
ncbi:HXXEE domain-containing protein [Mycobacterium sp. SMC-15]|uniref:HXXEE domain-containing protein n=1 Tax=Mycobacterium sp. SMC-15 TaxID=3381627 RepID=UPI0038777284